MQIEVSKNIPGWVFLVGLAFMGAGGYLFSNNYRWLSSGTETVGTVVGHNSSSRSRYPIVEFSTPDGQRITFTSTYGSSGGIAAKGEKISVMYMADDPHMADLKPGIGAWSFAIGFLLSGMLVCYLVVMSKLQKDPLQNSMTTNAPITPRDGADGRR